MPKLFRETKAEVMMIVKREIMSVKMPFFIRE
jgi:hypothetical protein